MFIVVIGIAYKPKMTILHNNLDYLNFPSIDSTFNQEM